MCSEPAPCKHFHAKKIDPAQDRHVRRYEVLPGGHLASLRRWRYAVPAEDVSDRLIADGVTEIGQRSHDPVISPTGILSGHADDEFHDYCRNGGTAGACAMPRSIELVGDEPTIPSKNRSGLATTATSASAWRPSRLPISDKGRPLRIGQPQAAWQMCSQDCVLGDQALILQQGAFG
jgi:hypothetical protein